MSARPKALAIFVGGGGSRMGGLPKGLLRHEGEHLVTRLHRIALACSLETWLVGSSAAYAGLLPEAERVADDPSLDGPVAGLMGCLPKGVPFIAIACDMPFVRADAVTLLLEAEQAHPDALAVVPRREDDLYEPLLAVYRPELLQTLRELGSPPPSFQQLLRNVRPIATLPCAGFPHRTFDDWDTPADRS